VDASSGAVVYRDGAGRECLEAPVLGALPAGVEALEHFEVLEGERFYWSDGRLGPKGRRRGARLMARLPELLTRMMA
jgi:hypothetical protein